MSYRDESDSLRARVGQLEGELAQASETIARLEGATPSAGIVREVKESSMLGAPAAVVLEHTLPFEVDERGYEAIAEIVRARLALQVSQVGHALTTLSDRFSLRRESGKTVVRLRGDWSLLKGGIIALPAMATFFGGLPIIGVLHDLSIHGSPMSLLHAAWMIPAVAGAAAYFGRSRAKQQAETNLRTHQGVFETVIALAEKHAVRAPGAQVRVDVRETEDAVAEPASREERRAP